MKFWLKSKIPRLGLLLEHQEISPRPCHLMEPLPFSDVPGFQQEPTETPGRGWVFFFCDFRNTESPLVCPCLALIDEHIPAMGEHPEGST